MKIGIMGAMTEEISGIMEQIKTSRVNRIGSRDFIEGTWRGLDVVVVFSRWGKVAAAVTATILLQHFAVDGILFVGVAGAVDPALNVGDIVVATDLIQHDMDASAIPPLQRFEIPLLGRSRLASDAFWMSAALSAANSFVEQDFEAWIDKDYRTSLGIGIPKVTSGLIATGDRFVADPVFLRDLRQALPDLRCLEMEGAAVAQACFELEKPFAVVRIISDHADNGAPQDFQKFIQKVSSLMGLGIASYFTKAIVR
jgi:adenosylhomocysteine nucleosidase